MPHACLSIDPGSTPEVLDRCAVNDYLHSIAFLAPDEDVLQLAVAGEGNMNLTLRVITDRRRVILKRSFPWVEKYPEIPAPAERIAMEALFYERTAAQPAVSARMPRLLHFDPDTRTLLLEDLGAAASYADLYQGVELEIQELDSLLDYLGNLHRGGFGPVIDNREMRRLNHQHIFELPLSPDNPVDLEAVCRGLSDCARRLAQQPGLPEALAALGRLYLAPGASLLHGDFYPGSWLRGLGGVKVIDPEFCFHGPPEFDLGVLLGHLVMTRQSPSLLDRVLQSLNSLEVRLVQGFAGAEIVRRLLGVAQLPLGASLSQRQEMLEMASGWLGL